MSGFKLPVFGQQFITAVRDRLTIHLCREKASGFISVKEKCRDTVTFDDDLIVYIFCRSSCFRTQSGDENTVFKQLLLEVILNIKCPRLSELVELVRVDRTKLRVQAKTLVPYYHRNKLNIEHVREGEYLHAYIHGCVMVAFHRELCCASVFAVLQTGL